MADAFKACAVDGCNGNAHNAAKGGRGWCVAHYTRWRRHGDPTGGGTNTGAPLAFLEQALASETNDCINWPYGRGWKGRAKVWIGGRNCPAARVICERAHGAPPTPEHEAAHSCGKGHVGCINPRHLRWATPKENNADRLIHGTDLRGERNHLAKLAEADVREIRRLALEGMTQRAIARQYEVSEPAISLIVRRKSSCPCQSKSDPPHPSTALANPLPAPAGEYLISLSRKEN
jgi:hypothetical protein